MTSTAEVGSQVVAQARGMRDLVRAEAAESERMRTLTPAIVDGMWACGLMSSFNPIPAGGVEPSFTEMIETWIEMLGRYREPAVDLRRRGISAR